MENNHSNKSRLKDAPSVASIFLFMLLLSMGGLLSWVLPKTKVSEIEKRALTPLPAFSAQTFFAGAYTDSLDLYYADNFPFRDSFVDFSGWVKDRFGWSKDVRIYATHSEIEPAIDSSALAADSVMVGNGTVSADSAQNKPAHSILIYKGAGFQRFSGSTAAVKDYAKTVNEYKKELGDSINVFCMVAPSAIDFYLPLENKTEKNLEGPNIQGLYGSLDSGVFAVDAYSKIAYHQMEYLYFKTDHHWTARGAFYAYRAFCESAGLIPYELSQLRRSVRKNFVGSLYGITRDARLKENPDSLESFRLPIQTKTYRYPKPALDSVVMSPLFVEMTNYQMFLGGDWPLVHIRSELGNGRRVLVIKDSFGNAVCPFLALHFEDVFVVDYRSFNYNLVDFARKNKITDLLFIHSTFIVNTAYTARREAYLMRTWRKAPDAVLDNKMEEMRDRE